MKILIQKIDSNSQSTVKIFLYNSNKFQLSVEINVEGFSKSVLSEKSIFLNPGEIKEFYRSFFHLMDNYPLVSYEITPYSTLGREPSISGEVKVKGKDFVTKMVLIEVLNEKAMVYPIKMNLSQPNKDTKSSISYHLKEKDKVHLKKIELYNAKELANFNPIIDLHLHKLVDDVSKVKSGMALLIQLSAFEKHLEMAIKLGLDRIFVIHGVGEGKLRKAIISSAKSNIMVKEVRNDYHPKFGFGSTEIII
jgi:hypothetical protein